MCGSVLIYWNIPEILLKYSKIIEKHLKRYWYIRILKGMKIEKIYFKRTKRICIKTFI